MRLQLALDGTLADSLRILESVRPYIDLAEIGTPLVLREGVRALRQVRAAFPDLALLADVKIVDAGELEARIAFEAGANIVTILGAAADATIAGAVKVARQSGGEVMVDLIQLADPANRALECLTLGCDYVCAHIGHDRQGESSLTMFEQIRYALPEARLAVAGGINLDSIDSIVVLCPAVVIVGSAITGAENPVYVASALRERIKAYG